MKQQTLARGFEHYTKKTRRALFLEEMEQVVPWAELCGLIESVYAKAGKGRPPVGVQRMLRICFLQQWFNLSDPGVEEALYDSADAAVCGHRSGAGAGAGRDHGLQVPLFVGGALVGGAAVRVAGRAFAREGTAPEHGDDRGCDDYQRSEFDQERAPGAGSGDAPDAQGQGILG
jgi:Transposase domain (DUF772)